MKECRDSIKFEVYIPSLFLPQFHSGSQFIGTCQQCRFLRLIIIIIFFRRDFSECTEAIATSLISLVTNFPDIMLL